MQNEHGLQYILLGLVVFVHPIMPGIVLVGLSLFSFQKHDRQEGFFDDRWGILGSVSFLVGIIIYLVLVYLPSRA